MENCVFAFHGVSVILREQRSECWSQTCSKNVSCCDLNYIQEMVRSSDKTQRTIKRIQALPGRPLYKQTELQL